MRITSIKSAPALNLDSARLRAALAAGPVTAAKVATTPDVVSMVRPPEPSEGGGSSAIWVAAGVAALLGIGIVVVRARSKRR